MNHEGYRDPTADIAIKNAEREVKAMHIDILRGDIFYVEKMGSKPTGSEQWAGRPAIVVSNNTRNRESDVIEVVYLTGSVKTPLPTHVKVIAKIPSIAICEQITSVSKSRLGEYIKSCTEKEMQEIDRALAISLGLTPPAQPGKATKPNTDSETGQDGRVPVVKMSSEMLKIMSSDREIRLETERDLYKKLYEDTLERLIG